MFVLTLMILDKLDHDHVIGSVFTVYGAVFASLTLILMLVSSCVNGVFKISRANHASALVSLGKQDPA